MQAPLVSVLMPVYNGEKFLAEAIDSILSQTFSDFEFIIINDGSTDGSEKIILSYKDERIRYVRNERNLKIIETLNKGFDLAKGKYIARMDADDVSMPERFAKQVEFMEANPEYGLCGSDVEVNNEGKKEVFKWIKTGEDEFVRFSLLFYNPICHPTTFLRTSIIKQHKLYYDKKYVHAEDYELWVQIAKHAKIGNLPDKLLRYRIHDQQISVQFSELQERTVNEVKFAIYKCVAKGGILDLKAMHLFLVSIGFSGTYPNFKEILYTFRKSGFLKATGNKLKLKLWLSAMKRGNDSRKNWKNSFVQTWLEEIKKAAAIKD